MSEDSYNNIVEPEPTGLNAFLKIRWLVLLFISVIVLLLFLKEVVYGTLTVSLILFCIVLLTFFYGMGARTKKVIYFVIAVVTTVPIPFLFATTLHDQNLAIALYVAGFGWAMFTLFYIYYIIKTKRLSFTNA
jgi:hypothetical protein